VPSWLSSQFF